MKTTKTCLPSKREFLSLVDRRSVPPIYKEIAYKRPSEYYSIIKRENSFILESIKGQPNIARYSFIGFDPYLIFKVKNSVIEIIDSHGLRSWKDFGKGRETDKLNPLKILKEFVSAYPQAPLKELPSFQGGAVGLISYDFVRYLERIPKTVTDDLKIPDMHFFLVDKVIAFDHIDGRAWIILCPGAEVYRTDFGNDSDIWEKRYDKAVEKINEIEAFLMNRKRVSSTNSQNSLPEKKLDIIHEMSKNDYMDIVRRTLKYIAAGDIFQANLSQRVYTTISGVDPWNIYKILSSINPSPFACYIDFGEYQIASSSPERLVKVNRCNDSGLECYEVETRPIAGTRPRGRDVYGDEEMRAELLLSEKERAEHIMLIDLERNDLGRVCDYGTISADELMITEDYSHVIHIVSNIRGRLAPVKDCFDVIRATFPGGTITGVPKVRCMEIIDELEPVARGPYTGSVGYIGFSKNMDLNIIIRSFVIKNETAYVQVGAGIVADSDPEQEYYETLKKAEALIKTIGRL